MFVHKQAVMAMLGVKSSETIRRMIARGELPPFDFGEHGRKQGWLKSTFTAFAALKAGQRIGGPGQVVGQEVNVHGLGGPDAGVAKELRHVADRRALAQQLRGEQVPKRVWPKRPDPGLTRKDAASVKDGLPGSGVVAR